MKQFYWKSTCSTCRDARKDLAAKGVTVDEINYTKTGLAADIVEAIVAKAKGVANVINARHEIAKSKGWGTTPPDAKTYAKAVAAEPNLIRRPLLVDGDRVIVGFDRDAYAKLR